MDDESDDVDEATDVDWDALGGKPVHLSTISAEAAV